MRIASLMFALGCLGCQWLPELPDRLTAELLLLAGMALLAGVRWCRYLIGPAMLLAGFGWASVLASQRLADVLPIELEGKDTEIVGVVAALPQTMDNGSRFEFAVERADAGVPSRLSLSWYRGWRPQLDDDWHQVPELRAGERWRLVVRLKRPHGSLNPYGFDFESWFLEQGLRATGYVRAAPRNRRLDEMVIRPATVVERWRQVLRSRYFRLLGDAPYTGVLVALAIGDQHAISSDLWQVFARTGVTHLLSVSGLHVTMVAGLAAWLAGRGWRRSPRLMLLLPAQKAETAVGFVAALLYCLLAGFAVPAQRTLYMLATVAIALWVGRTTAASRVLASALLIVLILDPWAVLSAGFWLSFGAVGLLFYAGLGRLAEGHWLSAWGRAQWAVTVGMLPVLLALFQQFSLVSPLANAVAIPVVSLIVTPLALLGTLPLAAPLLWLANAIMVLLMILLDALAASDWAVWQQGVPAAWAVALALVGAAWLLLPPGIQARWLGAVMLLPLFLAEVSRPLPGEMHVVVLDVGQGLAVHVQTASHDLLYDTGPAYGADADSGNRIIVPYLRAAGVRRLDTLVISHSDKDHEGGAESVLEALPVDLLRTSLPEEHPLSAQPVAHRSCFDGDHWSWDGIDFRMLHPAAADYALARKSNDVSCVLRITAASGSLLLTGDIEASDEAAIVARHGRLLASDVIVPPHHGSRGASTATFVAAVNARLAIFSAGYRNRFGHPVAEVVDRYRAGGAQIRRTDQEGAVSLELGRDGVATAAERQRRRRYWLAD